jgi:glycosyltransferase involved in cell wall biosynthesis
LRHLKFAYILLWFPKPSETFIFREVVNLKKMGLSIQVFSLYGEIRKGLSEEMESVSSHVVRFGIPYIKSAGADIVYWLRRNPRKLLWLLKTVIFRRWYGLEKTGENLWAFLCAPGLARRFMREEIHHIHAPWASGPATAAWAASHLTGIPFSFTARAWDIYPPDGILKEKINDALFVRSETFHNIAHLAQFADGGEGKIHLTYNGVPLKAERDSPVSMIPPYQLLSVGRFVGKKGYEFLLEACKILKEAGLSFNLVLAGDGPLKSKLKRLSRRFGLEEMVSFPGFVSYDHISKLFESADIFLMPSVVHTSGDRDGIPTVIMESLSHRVPVIATDVSGIPEIIEDGVTGLLIPQKNSASLAQAIIDLAKDRKGAIRTAEQGRARVFEKFNPEKNHANILRLYEQALGESSRFRKKGGPGDIANKM